MSVVTLAVLIVASFVAGGGYFLTARGGGGAWLAFMVGFFLGQLVLMLSPMAVP